MYYFFFFFFSSRRRHTRLQGDWSSDVCSSDLHQAPGLGEELDEVHRGEAPARGELNELDAIGSKERVVRHNDRLSAARTDCDKRPFEVRGISRVEHVELY